MANPMVTFETSKGVIRAEIYRDQMPVTAGNFLELVEMGFYDGLHFHRVIEGFVIQLGCPYSRDPHHTAVGTGESPLGTIADEFLESAKLSNEPGTLSMANAGPGTGGSQFFVNCAHNKQLDWFRWFGRKGQHPVFGRVTQGMDVVQAIECAPVDEWDVPVEPVKVERVTIEEP